MSVQILIGDCREKLRELPDASVHSIVCDPPYELNFMGRDWDRSGIANDVEMWRECLRVLRPGGHLVAFAASRTYHRMVCAIEDAGFEIRDCIQWIFGSGFPKSLDVSKAIDKAHRRDFVQAAIDLGVTIPGNNLHDWTKAEHAPGDAWWEKFKAAIPAEMWAAIERRVVSKGTSGATAIWSPEGGMGEFDITAPATAAAREWQGWGTALKPACEPICLARKPLSEKSVAANVLKWGTGAINVDACRIEGEPWTRDNTKGRAEMYDGWGMKPNVKANESGGRWPANVCHDGSDEVVAGFPAESDARGGREKSRSGAPGSVGFGAQGGQDKVVRNDSGSAARFFYCAKATTEERGEGNNHPTVKPVALMEWLVKLVTPKGGTVLDPFMGSGSTALACDRLQFDFIGCELSPEYAAIAEARIRAAAGMFADVRIAA